MTIRTVTRVTFLAAFMALLVLPASCARPTSPATSSRARTVPDALPGPQANMPAPQVPPAAAPNPGSFVESGKITAANLEASTMKIGAKAYLATHQGTLSVTSDELVPLYFSGTPKAKYYVNADTGSIVRVDSVPGGWTGIVFSLSQQRWVQGAPDNDHPNDQDVP